MMKSTNNLNISHFIHEDSIFEMLSPKSPGELPPVVLLDGEWLLRRAAKLEGVLDRNERKKFALPRRQDLERNEPEAFMSLSRLRELQHHGGAEEGVDGELAAWRRINSPLRLVCVSHCWHGAEHPDPFGDNLWVLADALIKARQVERFPQGDFAVFLDWCSLHQRDASGWRSVPEKAAFSQALSKMNLWYAHQKTLVFLLTGTPKAWPADTVSYHSRGWPSFERMISVREHTLARAQGVGLQTLRHPQSPSSAFHPEVEFSLAQLRSTFEFSPGR